MESVNCNSCGSSNSAPWKRIAAWQIVRCSDCGFAFLNPRPTPEELDALLTDERVSAMYDGAMERSDADIGSVADRLAMLARFKKGGSILDVGCGEGTFLTAVRDLGWAICGIEIIRGPGQRAKERLGDAILIGDILEADLPASSFDAVTMWDSLEHVRNPTAVIEKLRTLLKPDGVLIVRVQNCVSFDSIVYGKRWIHWSLPLHMNHFTPRTIRRFLEKNGFEIELVDTKISTIVWSLRNSLRLRPRQAGALKEKSASTLSGRATDRGVVPRESFLFRTLKRFFSGREVPVVARPK